MPLPINGSESTNNPDQSKGEPRAESDDPKGKLEMAPEVLELINNLNPKLPEEFRVDAAITAHYITMLDQMPDLASKYPPTQRFAEQLKNTGFITQIYNSWSLSQGRQERIDPSIGLPTWLQRDDYKRRTIDPERASEVKELYGRMMQGISFSDEANGRYFTLNRRSSIPTSRMFKTYVEGDSLYNGLQTTLPDLLENLEKNGLSPSELKLTGPNRLVFYFGQDIHSSSQILAYFNTLGIRFRGPVQDVFSIVVNENGELKLSVFKSNDQALGEGDGTHASEYRVQRYSQVDFLKNYLAMCAFTGKRPVRPYETSFVYFVDEEGVYQDKQKEASIQATQLSGYPVVYLKNRRSQGITLV